jgi:chemotaxis protein CheX
MTEAELKAIIGVVTQYFKSVTGEPVSMGMPYMKDDRTAALGYTGVIGISGSRRGGIYFTTGEELLSAFGAFILGEAPTDNDSLYDLVGEMTNTVAGNLREIFGSAFNISVPIVLKGKIDEIVIMLKPPVFIIPIEWRGHACHLAVGLE